MAGIKREYHWPSSENNTKIPLKIIRKNKY